MKVELSNTEMIFIYGYFKKKLSEIEKIEHAKGCPFDKETINQQKAPYISVLEKLAISYPGLKELDKYDN